MKSYSNIYWTALQNKGYVVLSPKMTLVLPKLVYLSENLKCLFFLDISFQFQFDLKRH